MKLCVRCLVLLLLWALVACSDYAAQIDDAHSKFIADNSFSGNVSVDSYCTCTLDMANLAAEYGVYIYDYSNMGNGFIRWYVTECPAGAALNIVPDAYSNAMSLNNKGDYSELTFSIFGKPSSETVISPSMEMYVDNNWVGIVSCPAAYVSNGATKPVSTASSQTSNQTSTQNTSKSNTSTVVKSSSSRAKTTTVSSSSKVASASSSPSLISKPVSLSNKLCYDMWCGPIGMYQVETFLDDGSNTSGWWYDFNDNASGGKSEFVYPVELGNEFSDDSKDPVIDYCSGICGTYYLRKGTLDYDPFVALGFDVGGYSKTQTLVDATAWGGVCVAYTSDHDIELRLGMGSMERIYDDDLPRVILSAAKTSPVKSCFSWDDFEQAGWGQGEFITGPEAATQLGSLKFMIQTSSGTKGTINIISVGTNYSM